MDSEAYEIARGLYNSKVSIQRPPTAAQHGVFTASSRGPPPHAGIKPCPFSAKAEITTERVGEKTNVRQRSRLPWRPFSGHAALNRPAPLENKESDSGTVKMKEELSCDSDAVPSVYKDRCLPKNITILQEWLTEDVPNNWPTQLTPKHSFVFLPCMQSEECVWDKLPAVPPTQQPDDLLIFTPVPQVKKCKPPKPRFQSFVEEDDRRCKHRSTVLFVLWNEFNK